MKVTLDRTEIQQAISCFLKQKGLEHEDFSMTISYNGAIIDLNKSSEPIKEVDSAEMNKEPTATDEQAVPTFGTFGSE